MPAGGHRARNLPRRPIIFCNYVHRRSREAMPKLTNVSINLNLPWVGSISGTWEPDESEVKAAWELYVEMVTRTPLGSVSLDEGSAREALTSIYSLFETTRGILKEYGPGIAIPKRGRELSLGYLAVSMLNHVLRPLLTAWHPRLARLGTREPGQARNGMG